MDVNKYERLQLDPETQIKVKEQVVLRKDMDEINIRGYPTLNLSYVFLMQWVQTSSLSELMQWAKTFSLSELMQQC
jgi:hypothetical protein